MSKHRMAVRLNLPTLLGALALASVAGCETDGENDNDERAQVDSDGLDGSIDGSSADAGADADAGEVDGGPDAGGPIVGIDGGLANPHITAVVVNGTGCTPDSYTAAIAPDGQSVTVKLNAFDLEVSAESALAVKDCQLGVEITAEDGKQYQLSRASVRGVIALDEGVSARVQVNRYFQGNPAGGEEWRTDLTGPLNDDLVLDEPAASNSWSPCGVARDVNVRFTGRLTNSGAPQRDGYVKLDQAQVFNLNSRDCSN